MLASCRRVVLAVFVLWSCGGDDGHFPPVGGTDAARVADGPPPDADPFAHPRTSVDQPDDEPGAYQVHLVYVVPADRAGVARLDEDGTLRRAMAAADGWLADRTGGPRLRFDRAGGVVDVTHVVLAEDEATFAAGVGVGGPRSIRARLEATLASTLADPTKLYLVYYDGLALGTCGESPRPGRFPVQYVGGMWSTTMLASPAAAGATTATVLDPVALGLPPPPFTARLGAEAVTVTTVAGTSVTLAAPLAAAHPALALLAPDGRPGDCRANPWSADGVAWTYAVFVGLHEVMHALGIVADAAPDHAPPPTAAGHLAATSPGGLDDLMYQGPAGGRCGDPAPTPAQVRCQLDPGRRNYHGTPAGSGLVDLARSVFLDPTPVGAVPPPGW